eukprot:905906-Rhodomonas_salina.1
MVWLLARGLLGLWRCAAQGSGSALPAAFWRQRFVGCHLYCAMQRLRPYAILRGALVHSLREAFLCEFAKASSAKVFKAFKLEKPFYQNKHPGTETRSSERMHLSCNSTGYPGIAIPRYTCTRVGYANGSFVNKCGIFKPELLGS